MTTVTDIIKCVNFAAIKHQNQRRKDKVKTPYINHPIGVAAILTHEAGIADVEVIQAALLHDTVEDTDTTIEEIQQEFGETIAGLVGEVTDDKLLPYQERKRLQIEHAPTTSTKAKLVKLADKLHNLRDLERCMPEGWTSERADQYFAWAARCVCGLRGTNSALEKSLDAIFERHGVLDLAHNKDENAKFLK